MITNTEGSTLSRRQRQSRKNRHKPDLPIKRRRRGENRQDDSSANQARQPFLDASDRHNEQLEAYYTRQKILPEEELPKLFASLAQPLPTSFRVCSDSRFKDKVCRKLETDFTEIFKGLTSNDSNDPLLPPQRLSWYPGGLAWTVATPRFLVRRNNVLAPFHRFLVQMNDVGAINRQEAVSMVPPLLLDLKPGQSVIDLCAAPGSKSAQLLEALATSLPAQGSFVADGLLVANDVDIKRCWMLAHQLRRFGSPNLVVTHHDAQSFPSVITFDRVLCDVPCTGDGTLRKAPDMWRRWNPQLGNGIHRLQKSILRRGIELLKPGGRIVYSTCSMNPVENEAVVAHALRQFGADNVELLDVSHELPLLKRRAGLRTWQVKDTAFSANDGMPSDCQPGVEKSDNGKKPMIPEENEAEGDLPFIQQSQDGWFSRYEDVPERRRRRVVQSLFPPSEDELSSGNYPLERCLRLVPLDQDTGAFFVAVLRKKEGLHARQHKSAMDIHEDVCMKNDAMESTTESSAQCDAYKSERQGGLDFEEIDSEKNEGDEIQACGVASGETSKTDGCAQDASKSNRKTDKSGSRLITDDPLVGLERINEALVAKLADFYGLEVARCKKCLMTRGSEADRFKRILVVSPGVRHLLTMSIGSAEGAAAGIRGRLRVVNAGVRLFERTGRRDAVVPFRILSDGVHILRASMSERIIDVAREDLFKILANEQVDVRDFSHREVRAQLDKMPSGSALMVMGQGVESEVILIWKGQFKVTKLMPSEEVAAMLMRHGLSQEKKLPSEQSPVENDDTKQPLS